VAISPQGIRADLFLRCPKSGESPTVTLRLDHQVFRGVRKWWRFFTCGYFWL